MTTPHESYEPLMVDVLFDEATPAERTTLQTHLDECDACAEAFEQMQTTLQVTARRERPEMPPAYWDSYATRLHRRMHKETAASAPSWADRLHAWWASLPALLPTTGPQWALQAAVAVLLLGVGLWVGRGASSSETSPLALDNTSASDAQRGLSDLLLATQPISADVGTARPAITGVEDVTYDVTEGIVEIRYNTVNDVVVRGRPDDPAIQRLLETALLDEGNPASRLHAVKTMERASVRPDAELVRALTYLAREEASPDLRLRAVRALRALQERQPLNEGARHVLIDVLLHGESEALRIEALEALTAGSAPSASRDFLYPVQNDSNEYLRYRARELLRASGAESAPRARPLGNTP